MTSNTVNPIIDRRISAALHAMSCLREASDSETFTDAPEVHFVPKTGSMEGTTDTENNPFRKQIGRYDKHW